MPGRELVNRTKNVIEIVIGYVESISPHILALAIVAYLIGTEFLTINYHQPSGDLGEFVNNAYRVINGEMPYRDFWLLFTPGEVFFPALIYKIFGVNVDALRYTMIVLSCSTALIAFYFGRELFGKNWLAAIFTFLYYYSSVIYHYESPAYIHFYYALMFLAAWQLAKLFKTGQSKYAAFAGAALAAAVFFRLYESLAGIAGMGLALLYYSIAAKKNLIKLIGSFAAGFFIVLVVEFLPFVGIMSHLIREAVFESVKNGTSMNLPYFWDAKLMAREVKIDILARDGIMKIPLIISHSIKFAFSFIFYILPFVIPVLAVIFFRLERSASRRALALTFLLWGAFSFAKGLGRSDLCHLSPSAAPWMMFILYSAFVAAGKPNDRAPGRRRYVLVSGILVAEMLLVGAAPILRLFDQIRMPFYKMHAPYGSYAQNKLENFESDKFAIENVLKYTRERDYIFVTPWYAPALYAMTHRRNATYYDSMNDPVIRPSAKTQERVIDALIASKTKLIVHADWGYDEKPEQRFKNACRMIQSFIESNYTMVGKHGAYEIWLLKNS